MNFLICFQFGVAVCDIIFAVSNKKVTAARRSICSVGLIPACDPDSKKLFKSGCVGTLLQSSQCVTSCHGMIWLVG